MPLVLMVPVKKSTFMIYVYKKFAINQTFLRREIKRKKFGTHRTVIKWRTTDSNCWKAWRLWTCCLHIAHTITAIRTVHIYCRSWRVCRRKACSCVCCMRWCRWTVTLCRRSLIIIHNWSRDRKKYENISSLYGNCAKLSKKLLIIFFRMLSSLCINNNNKGTWGEVEGGGRWYIGQVSWDNIWETLIILKFLSFFLTNFDKFETWKARNLLNWTNLLNLKFEKLETWQISILTSLKHEKVQFWQCSKFFFWNKNFKIIISCLLLLIRHFSTIAQMKKSKILLNIKTQI